MADGAAAGRARRGAVGVGGVWACAGTWCAARVVCAHAVVRLGAAVCAHAGGDGVIGGGRRVCVVARLCDGAGRRG